MRTIQGSMFTRNYPAFLIFERLVSINIHTMRALKSAHTALLRWVSTSFAQMRTASPTTKCCINSVCCFCDMRLSYSGGVTGAPDSPSAAVRNRDISQRCHLYPVEYTLAGEIRPSCRDMPPWKDECFWPLFLWRCTLPIFTAETTITKNSALIRRCNDVCVGACRLRSWSWADPESQMENQPWIGFFTAENNLNVPLQGILALC